LSDRPPPRKPRPKTASAPQSPAATAPRPPRNATAKPAATRTTHHAPKAKPAPLPPGAKREVAEIKSFRDLDLSPEMIEALDAAGYTQPTPIQAGLIPLAIEDLDVLGQARTGTGKTAAFAIPIIEGLHPAREVHGPQALILVPTRELAVQVREEIAKLSYGRRIGCVALYGGKPIRQQIEKLKRGAMIIVGTPGRVLDHIARRTLLLDDLWCVVLDEADRMLDIGFRPDIEKILRKCPQDRQTLLLSATVPPAIEKLAQRYMYQPKTLNFSPSDVSVETIEQFYFTVDNERKFDLLVRLMQRENPQQAIIFCRTKRGTEKIFQRLSKRMEGVSCIHGDMNQGARDRTMSMFREGKVKILVATDVVGRGIDVSSISHIINYDIPAFADDYVHRVGRTGRMGREGVAYTFVSPEEGGELTRIEQRINLLLKRGEMSDFELVAPPRTGPMYPPGENGEPNPNAPPPPPESALRRPVKRYRRAL
jgi:ATP-dependent RNA helicase DeaD